MRSVPFPERNHNSRPTVYDFAFLTSHPDRFEELKPVFDAVLDSMKPSSPFRSRPRPRLSRKGRRPLPERRPRLPELEDEEVFSAPDGRFTVTLPPGAVKDGAPRPEFSAPSGEVATYGIAGKRKDRGRSSPFQCSSRRRGVQGQPGGGPWRKSGWRCRHGRGPEKGPGQDLQTRDGQCLSRPFSQMTGFLSGCSFRKRPTAGRRGWIQELITGVRFRERD